MILTHPQIYSEFIESLCKGHSVVHGVMAPEGRRPAGDLQGCGPGAGKRAGAADCLEAVSQSHLKTCFYIRGL